MNKHEIRKTFREPVFRRDNNCCVFCDTREGLDAHHITDRHEMPNGGYVVENSITLCHVHHLAAERFHVSSGKEWEPGMHPDDMYRKIKSSYQAALSASKSI